MTLGQLRNLGFPVRGSNTITPAATDTTILTAPDSGQSTTNRTFYLDTLHLSHTGTAATVVTIFDGASATGLQLFRFEIDPTTAGNETITITDLGGIPFLTGLVVMRTSDVTGGGTFASVSGTAA